MMVVESIMMVIAAIVVPNFLLGAVSSAGVLGIMILNNGFFRLPNDTPKFFWKFPVYYISLHNYANQGFYKNEYEGLVFPNGQFGGQNSTITGHEVLTTVWQMQTGRSKWIDLCFIVGMVLLCRFLFWGIIKGTEKIKPTR